MKKLSIVITNYNKGDRIITLLKQLAEQIASRNDIEVIIVDDCSTDQSINNIRKYLNELQNNSFILYENKENLGPGISRNRGLDLCTGKWITFIDGDDEIVDNYIDRMLQLSNTDEYDLICFDYDVHNCIDNGYVEHALNTMLWTKLFRASIFYDYHIRIDEEQYKGLVFGEDLELLYLYMCKTERHLRVEDRLIIYNWGIGICNRPPDRYQINVPEGWVENNIYLFR